MLDRIRTAIEFIAWENVADPRVWLAWTASLLAIALVTLAVRSIGALVLRGRPFRDETESLVMHVATGFSLLAVVLFVLGVAGLYDGVLIGVLVLGAILAPAVAARDARRLLDGPAAVARALRERGGWWILFAVCSLPALLPPYRWDEMFTHLAYAQQWVEAGSLTVDAYMRYPISTFNWTMVQGVALMAGSETLVHMLTWLCGALATLVVGLMLERLETPRPLRVTAMLAFFLTPVVQRYLVLGYHDVPLMFFLAASVFALFRMRDVALRTPRDVAAAALCAGMFVGMKVVGVLFVPLFLLLAAYRLRGRALTVYIVVFGVAGVLWYARNLVLAGDPVPPVLSEMRGLEHPFWSAEDMRVQRLDLERGLSWAPADVARLPLTSLTSTETGPLRDWPLLGYVLVFPFTVLLVRRLRRDRALDLLVAAWWGVGVWIYTSYFTRYAHVLPLVVVCAALRLSRAIAAWRPRRPAAWGWAAGALLLVGPTFASLRYLQHSFAQRIPVTAAERWAYVLLRLPEARMVDAVAAHAPPGSTVYSVGYTHLRYYFQRRGFRVIGEQLHHGRYGDFRRALESGRADSFIEGLPARYVAVAPADAGEIGMTAATVPEVLDGLSVLRPLMRDSASLLYEVHPRDLVRH